MTPSLLFLAGLALGALLVWLWMRARIERLDAAREFAETAASQMEARFQAAADSALRSSQSAFLEAARTTLDAVGSRMSLDLAQRQSQIEGVVQPIHETLGRLDVQVRELDKQRTTTLAGLDRQLQQLMSETGTLLGALRSPQARGRWGEITLRRVAELAGMVAQCDFSEQATYDSGAGARIRPDMIVHLPGGRALAVDAKAPLSAYLEALEAQGEKERRELMQRHAQQVASHVDRLGAKQYWSQIQPAPEMVVLFLPGEHFFSAAVEHRPSLIEDALAKNVIIATPVTLISILRGVAFGWRQEQLARNAEEIRRVAGEFLQRLAVFQESYADAGKQLAKAVEAFNRAAGAWESRLAPALRRIQELGIGENRDATLEPIDKAVREPKADV